MKYLVHEQNYEKSFVKWRPEQKLNRFDQLAVSHFSMKKSTVPCHENCSNFFANWEYREASGVINIDDIMLETEIQMSCP